MKTVKLCDICDVRDGTHDSPSYYLDGYPFITTKNLVNGTIDFSTASLICEEDFRHFDKRSHVDDGDILMPMIGTIGGAIIVNKDREFAIKNVALIKKDKESIDFNFLLHVLNSNKMLTYFEQFKTGGTQKFISLNFIRNLPIPEKSLPEQQKIAAHLDSIQSAIDNKKQQLQQLDELVKSKFVEMFGENNCKQVPFSEYAEIIDGDRGKNYPKSEEFYDDGYCLFLSAKNVTKNGFLFETNQFISEEKDKILRKGKLKRGDIVITTRGTIGNIAYFDETIPYENIRINSGMVIIRGKDLEFNQKFFLEAFRQKIDEIIATQVTGAAQPQLPIHIMSKITLPYPNIDLQNTFAEYVQKIDSTKSIIKTQLVDLQELLDSKMDEYFGE